MDHYSKSLHDISSSSSPFDCLLFDLDDTLYSSTIGIAAACKRNIEAERARKGACANVSAMLRPPIELGGHSGQLWGVLR
ncbi:hypothetical protein IFM89_005879 [Coptis chinensis]|uniref:Uncharacterized protein n=1 Tax=Coptis chinensis TaxID=261450 RepID=A0A835LLR5_9MAGN|nr:hypothetical protein IFM89_005879 [Coptis chinensis]